MQVPFELACEDAHGARHERDRTVRVTAGAAVRDLGEPPAKHRVVGLPARAGELGQIAGDRGETVDARPALARALVGEVARDPRSLDDAAGATRKGDDRARAERRPEPGEIRVRERRAARVGRREPRAEVAADEIRLGVGVGTAPGRAARRTGLPSSTS